MHPLKVEQPYPYEQWWIVAYSSEVSRAILGRSILGERIILYRTEQGEAVALSGICPHRSFPLEKSRLVDDNVQCGYHGFTFGKDGGCMLVPSQSGIPTNSSLRRYPVQERGNLIWIWTGEEDNADPALLPDLAAIGIGNPDWTFEEHPLMTIKGRYTLLIDNLMDLSHASYIHEDSIPGSDAIVRIPAELIDIEKSLNVVRCGKSLPLNPYISLQFPDQQEKIDQHFDAEFFGPALIRTGGTTYDSATGEELGTLNFIHGITPEGPNSVHYFVVTARNFGPDNHVLSKMNLDMGTHIQPQDKVAIEAVEQVLQTATRPVREISARVDNGALKARLRIERQIKAEMRGTSCRPA